MFQDIPKAILQRMQLLEELDARHRAERLPADIRLRQISSETGSFVAVMAASAPSGKWIEIGTSGGYSTLWLALAARANGAHVTTYEILEHKADLATDTFAAAGVEDVVTLVRGDARDHLADLQEISFCFLDAEKEIYQECYDLVIPRLVPDGILVADNAISHEEALQPMIDAALADSRVDAQIASIGRGELVCRRLRHE